MMPKTTILIVWSNYYNELAERQLSSCVNLLDQSNHDYHIEKVESGTYEIPAVIHYYAQNKPYDGYIPLSLLLKGSTDHYDFIWEHVKDCLTQFALNGLFIGNGIISAPNIDILTRRVESMARVQEAFNAVDYLIRLKGKFKN